MFTIDRQTDTHDIRIRFPSPMSTPVPRAGLNTPSGAAQAASIDVYARVMQGNSVIEDIIFIDGAENNTADTQACTCGMCDADADVLIDFEAGSNNRTKLAGAPMLYIETRANADPIVLDEYSVAADIEIISPRMIARTENTMTITSPRLDLPSTQWSTVSLASMIDATLAASFDPNTFNPYDPGIAVATDLL